jgi:NADPH2:quinone reductase
MNYTAQPSGVELSEVGRLIDAGKVRPRAEATFPLWDAAAAHEWLESGHIPGKIVLEIRA